MAARKLAVFFLLFAALLGAAADNHDHTDHDHHGEGEDEQKWEWSAIFKLEAGERYTWSFARGESGSYAEPTMKLAVLPAGSVGSHRRLQDLHAFEEGVEEIWENMSQWVNVTSGSTLQLGSGVTFILHFDLRSWVSLFHLQVSGSDSFAFFAEHMPSEFENGLHYLKDEHGDDVEPWVEEPSHVQRVSTLTSSGEPPSTLATAVAAAAVTAIPGLVMSLAAGTLLPCLSRWHLPAVYAFASGAIFSSALFLLLAEALELAGVDQEEEVTATWTWGVAIMAGWLLGLIIHHGSDILSAAATTPSAKAPDPEAGAISPAKAPDPEAGAGEGAVEGAGEGAGADEGAKVASAGAQAGTIAANECGGHDDGHDHGNGENPGGWAVAGPVLLGDFCHNLVDGIVVGIAAKACNPAALWAIVGATVAHEAPQELADFMLLVSKAGWSWKVAVLANSLTALPAAIIGSIISYEVEVSSNLQGLLLAFGGGVYLFVATTELASTMMHLGDKPTIASSLMRIGFFVLGATLIGLVLLEHGHCGAPEPEGAPGGGDDGHGHGR